MYYFLQLSFLQLVVFPALISGNAKIDQEENIPNEFLLRNYDNEEYAGSSFDNLLHRTSHRKPKGNFFLHTRENPEGVEFFFGIKTPYFKNDTPTKIITHGYSDKKERILGIVKEYLNSKQEVNVLTYFWEFNSGLPYKIAARLSDYLGTRIIGSNIAKLYKNYQTKPDHIHLIGYNLGAHLFGAAGRVQKHKIGRITGLDPARRCFEVLYKNTKLTPLTKNDATFVDIIHTNAKGKGVFEPVATVDFYPNGGIFQPQCNNIFEPKSCSSAFSYVYFKESIRKGENIWARKCSSFEKFLNKKCEKNPLIVFGEFVNLTAEGSYFFQSKIKNTISLVMD